MFVIAGVSGQVGSVVADRLLTAGKAVRAIVRDPAKGTGWFARGAEVAIGDLRDGAFMTAILRDASGCFVLIPPDYTATDVSAGQRQIADAIAAGVRASGVPRVVLLSSVGADLAEGTGPIAGLHYFEEGLRDTGAILIAVRAGYFQENAGAALVPAREAGIFPNFAERDDLAFPMNATRDVGEEIARILLAPPGASHVVDIVGPSYSARDVAAALGGALGKPLQVINLPRNQWVPTLTQAGLSSSGAESLGEMYDALGRGILQPRGDRQVRVTTPIEETMKNLVAAV